MGFETRRRTAEQRGGPIGVWAPEGIEGPGCGARGWRKNGNWTHAQPHFRYKTHPADPFSPHARYKTRPAGPKRPFLARFSRAGRTLYRFRQEKAEHGELCTACEAETGLAITAHQAPQVWRAPGGLEGTRGPGCGARGRRRHHRQPNFARNLSWSFFETPQKRCNSNDLCS